MEPALTPAEWAKRSTGDIYLEERGGIVIVSDSGRATEGYDRHALAALALHEQPFGFTQADVNFLRGCFEWESVPYNEWRQRIKHLQERIAALLPPPLE